MHGLVVGRFQPLHLGHEALVRRALADCRRVTVGIGSSNVTLDARNPFSAAERRAMLAACFPAELEDGRLAVVDLPDFGHDGRWTASTLGLVGTASTVDRFYGNDERTAALMRAAGITVVAPGLLRRDIWEGTALRRCIAAGEPGWDADLPPAVARLLRSWDAPRRLRALAG